MTVEARKDELQRIIRGYRQRYYTHRKEETAHYARTRANLAILRARLVEFWAWNDTPAAREACRWLEEAEWAAGASPDVAPWACWVVARAKAITARQILRGAYPAPVVDGLFECDALAVIAGDRCLDPAAPRAGIKQ